MDLHVFHSMPAIMAVCGDFKYGPIGKSVASSRAGSQLPVPNTNSFSIFRRPTVCGSIAHVNTYRQAHRLPLASDLRPAMTARMPPLPSPPSSPPPPLLEYSRGSLDVTNHATVTAAATAALAALRFDVTSSSVNNDSAFCSIDGGDADGDPGGLPSIGAPDISTAFAALEDLRSAASADVAAVGAALAPTAAGVFFTAARLTAAGAELALVDEDPLMGALCRGLGVPDVASLASVLWGADAAAAADRGVTRRRQRRSSFFLDGGSDEERSSLPAPPPSPTLYAHLAAALRAEDAARDRGYSGVVPSGAPGTDGGAGGAVAAAVAALPPGAATTTGVAVGVGAGAAAAALALTLPLCGEWAGGRRRAGLTALAHLLSPAVGGDDGGRDGGPADAQNAPLLPPRVTVDRAAAPGIYAAIRTALSLAPTSSGGAADPTDVVMTLGATLAAAAVVLEAVTPPDDRGALSPPPPPEWGATLAAAAATATAALTSTDVSVRTAAARRVPALAAAAGAHLCGVARSLAAAAATSARLSAPLAVDDGISSSGSVAAGAAAVEAAVAALVATTGWGWVRLRGVAVELTGELLVGVALASRSEAGGGGEGEGAPATGLGRLERAVVAGVLALRRVGAASAVDEVLAGVAGGGDGWERGVRRVAAGVAAAVVAEEEVVDEDGWATSVWGRLEVAFLETPGGKARV